MPSDIIGPTSGPPGAEDPGAGADPTLAPPPDEPPPVSSTSGDDLTASLTRGRPDPFLGGASGPDARPDPAPAGGAVRADALNALAGLEVSATDAFDPPPHAPAPSVSSSEAVAALDLTRPAAPAPGSPPGEEEDDDDEEDERPARGPSWGTMLLASYASAVTLGLIWVLWTGRHVREGYEPDFLEPADTRPDPGERAGASRRLVAPPPVAAEHVTTLGKPVRLGLIEATPLSVTSGPVTLQRTVQGRERKSGGGGALALRLRLRNASSDAVIAPFDEAFVRERARSDPDSFIETPEGGATVAMYPLALTSEWSIVGQEFRELNPGESFETVVVSAPDVRDRLAPEMTWRVRLRTDLNHTDDLGVRFRRDEVQPAR